MEAPKRIANKFTLTLEELPLDVHLNILQFLPLKDSVRSLFRVSKALSDIVRDALSKGKKNSLDCLISGTQKSGTTSLFWLLSQDKKVFTILKESQEQPEQPALPLRKEGMQYIKRITTSEGRTAVIFHGSNKPSRRKNMFPYYGLTQCLVIVVPAQIPEVEAELIAFKNEIKELILPAYALCGHMNWIFAINKMDLVEYSEKAFNDVKAIVLEICSKISNVIQQKISFVPISVNHSVNIFKDTKYGQNSPMPWFQGPSLLERMDEISMTIQMPIYKFFRRPSFVVIDTKEYKTLRKQKKNHPDDLYKLLIGYVTDGFFDITEKLHMMPNAYRHTGYKFDLAPRLAFNIESIKSFDSKLRHATAGCFLGIGIHLDVENEINKTGAQPVERRYPFRIGRNFLREWFDIFKYHHRGQILDAKPHYHRFSTSKEFIRVMSAEVQLVMVGSKSGTNRACWNGELKKNFGCGFYAQGIKSFARIEKIISVQGKNGSAVPDAEKIVKGQKATVELTFRFPIDLQIYEKNYTSESYPNSAGRFLLLFEQHVIAVGVVTGKLGDCNANHMQWKVHKDWPAW